MGTEDKKDITATEVLESPESEAIVSDGILLADGSEPEASEELEKAPDTGMDLSLDDELSLELAATDEEAETLTEPLEAADNGKEMNVEGLPDLELGEAGEQTESSADLDELEAELAAPKQDEPTKTLVATPESFEDKLKEIDSLLEDELPEAMALEDSTNPNLDSAVAELNTDLSSTQLDQDLQMGSDPAQALDEELALLANEAEIESPSVEAELAHLDEATAGHLLEEIEGQSNNLSEVEEGTDTGIIRLDEQVSSVLNSSESPTSTVQEYEALVQKDDQLLQMSATINLLRAERAKWQQELSEWKIKFQRLEDEFKLVKSEVDEKTIEVEIVHKKAQRDMDQLRRDVFVAEEKRAVLKEQNKKLEEEVKKFGLKNKFDYAKVHLREKELEQKLELLKIDSQSQIQHRDEKIMELKRRIDLIEFDLESMATRERKSKQLANDAQKKLESVLGQLKSTLTAVEDEHETDIYKLERRKLAG